jgi:hypothetical protein
VEAGAGNRRGSAGEEIAVTIAPPDLHLLAGANFGATLADPPWRFATWSDRCPDDKPIEGGSARLYETMSIEEIAGAPRPRALLRPLGRGRRGPPKVR